MKISKFATIEPVIEKLWSIGDDWDTQSITFGQNGMVLLIFIRNVFSPRMFWRKTPRSVGCMAPTVTLTFTQMQSDVRTHFSICFKNFISIPTWRLMSGIGYTTHNL